MDEVLKHHHIGGGGQAIPIPASLHMGSGGIHNIEKHYDLWGGKDAETAEIFEVIKSLTKGTKFWKNVRLRNVSKK